MAGRDDEGREPWDDEGGESSWTEADERRYQARRHEELKRGRRRRRQATSFTVLVLLVMGIGVGAAGVYQGWWEWPFGEEEAAAPQDTPTPCPTPEVTAAQPADVQVTVLNGTGERGLAATVSTELAGRGYVVGEAGNTESPLAEIAQVIHGPESLTAARSVAAQVDGSTLVDDGRAGPAVDLALGAGYTALRPPEVVAPLLLPAPAESPAGCVPPSAPTPATPGAPSAPAPAAPAEPAPTT